MNSRKNHVKRVAAGALAVLTVAAYSAPIANVGGLKNSLVANAAIGDYDVSFTWEEIADYMVSLSVNGTKIDGSAVTGSTNRKFAKASGSEVVIETKVPLLTKTAGSDTVLDLGANTTNLVLDNEAKVKAQGYKLEAGHYNVTEYRGVYTYTILLKDENNTPAGEPFELQGEKQDIAFYSYDQDATRTKGDIKTENLTSGSIQISRKDSAGALAQDNQTISGAADKYIINGKVVLQSDENFAVEIYDGSASTSTVDPDVVYNTKTKKYVCEFDMPKFKGDTNSKFNAWDRTTEGQNMDSKVCVVIEAKNAAVLTFTEKNNQLLANGLTVDTNTVAADITAVQQRAQVKDPETDAVIDEEIKAGTALAYNGTMKYGTEIGDGVSLTISRDDVLTKTGDTASLYKDAAAAVTIKKDGTYYKAGLPTGGAKGIGGGKVDKQNDWREILVGSATSTDFDYKFDADGKLTNLPKFTEAGEYEVTAEFFVKNETNGTSIKTINFKFTIAPIEIKASDVKISFDYNGIPEKTNANLVTPKAVSFKDNGVLEITIPDSLKGTTFNAHIEVPMLDKASYVAEFNKFVSTLGSINGAIHFLDQPEWTNIANVTKEYITIAANGKSVTLTNTGGTHTYSIDTVEELPHICKYASSGYTNPVNEYEFGEFSKYEVDGALKATKFDTTNRININIYDQNYGAPYSADGSQFATLGVRYKLVKEVQQPKLSLLRVHPDYVDDNHRLKVAAADTSLEKFEEIFWNNFEGNEIIEENKDLISFEYLEGTGRDALDDDLDSHTEGIPTKKSDINYTLYVLYDGEVFDAIDLEIVTLKTKIVPDESQLKITYGDNLEINTYKLVDSNGKTVKNIKLDEVLLTSAYVAKDGNLNKAGIQPKKDVDGKYMRENDNNIRPSGNSTLDAGTYIVTFGANLDVEADYTVSSDEYILVVDKKQITGDMFTTDAIVFDKKQHTKKIGDFKFNFQNANNAYNHKTSGNDYIDGSIITDEDGSVANDNNSFYVSGGTTKATAASKVTYNAKTATTTIEPNVIQISADDNNKNFTGTAEVNWYISTVANENQNIVDFTWDAENTLLYDEGRIHVQYGKTNDSKIKVTNPETKKPYVIEDYGVIVDKFATIAAPTTLDAASNNSTVYEEQKKGLADARGINTAANAALLYGNGYTIGHASNENKADSIYGANIKVEDVNKGIWVRPYALLDDGTVVYGESIFLDITREAKKQLQFQLNPKKKLDKTNNLAGYDAETGKYTFYASYTKFDAKKVKAQVKDFGVIVDKNGSFIRSGQNFVLASDKTTTIEDAFKFGKGFKEGHFNPKNEKLGANEYGAKITPNDTVTGIWVRGYIKLSDSLIVYTEPAYYNSVSDYYANIDAASRVGNYEAKFSDGTALGSKYEKFGEAKTPSIKTTNVKVSGQNKMIVTDSNARIQAYIADTTAPANDLKYENASGKFKIAFFNNIKANDSSLTFVKQGVIVDKNESLVTREYSSIEKTFAYTIKPEANTKFVLGKGFIEGQKNKAANNYTASVTPVVGKAITVRPYTVFKVTGTNTEIVVYGDIRVISTDGYIFQ
jgi:hypothetical protein